MDEAGGLRVAPEDGFGPALPPELVVESACEGPGGLGASEVVLKDLVVPPDTGDVGVPGGSGDKGHSSGWPRPRHACGWKPSLRAPQPPSGTCGGGLLL